MSRPFKEYSRRLDQDFFILIDEAPDELMRSVKEFVEQHRSREERKQEKLQEEERPKFKCLDGHWVKSRAERSIDDWLYVHKYIHVYEYRLPFEEREYYCDFYLPSLDIYIEYWGLRTEVYTKKKNEKKKLYEKYKLKLIELEETDLGDLDKSLGRKLRG